LALLPEWVWVAIRQQCGVAQTFPTNESSGHLHHHEQRRDGANRNCQSGEALEEKGVGKRDQINELCQRRFTCGEARAHHQPQI